MFSSLKDQEIALSIMLVSTSPHREALASYLDSFTS